MYHITYKITNLIDNKEYIGKHSTKDLNDGYFGSSKTLKQDVKKLGKSNFKFQILKYHQNYTDALNHEAQLVNEDYIKREDTYNKTIGGGGNSQYKHNIEVINTEYKSYCDYYKENNKFSDDHTNQYFKNLVSILQPYEALHLNYRQAKNFQKKINQAELLKKLFKPLFNKKNAIAKDDFFEIIDNYMYKEQYIDQNNTLKTELAPEYRQYVDYFIENNYNVDLWPLRFTNEKYKSGIEFIYKTEKRTISSIHCFLKIMHNKKINETHNMKKVLKVRLKHFNKKVISSKELKQELEQIAFLYDLKKTITIKTVLSYFPKCKIKRSLDVISYYIEL